MGTNYYLHKPGETPHCPSCDCFCPVHIGKSSQGWQFSFRGYREPLPHIALVIVSFEDWKSLLTSGAGVIRDEYGKEVPATELLTWIVEKQDSILNQTTYVRKYHEGDNALQEQYWLDPYGYSFCGEEFC